MYAFKNVFLWIGCWRVKIRRGGEKKRSVYNSAWGEKEEDEEEEEVDEEEDEWSEIQRLGKLKTV